MKKTILSGVVILAAILLVVMVKGRHQPPHDAAVVARSSALAIDEFLAKNPSDLAAPQLRRLSTALKARPSYEETVLGQSVARSMADGAVTPQEAAMLDEAADLAGQEAISEQQIQEFTSKFPEAVHASAGPAGVNGIPAINHYIQTNPSGRGVAQLRRLLAAHQTRPAQTVVLVGAAAQSVEDSSVSGPEEAMLDEAAALAGQETISELQVKNFSAKFPAAVSTSNKPGAMHGVSAINHYIETKPSGRGVPQLRRLLTAGQKRPAQTQALTDAAAQSVADGDVSTPEAAMLEQAARLAEREQLTEADVKTLTTKFAAVTGSQRAAAPAAPAAAHAASAIDTYLQKHPSGKGTAQLRRLSAAMKQKPAQPQVLAEAVARSVADGKIAKEEEIMLEEAATLAEREGLSPSEMAEFSRKYEKWAGAHTIGTAKTPDAAPAVPLPSFVGKRQLVYTFDGTVRCTPTPCTNIRVSVRVTAGKWVETRDDGVDGQGHYVLQLPVMSSVNDKVSWEIEGHDNDLRKAELKGQRVSTAEDKNVSVSNDLVLSPAHP